VTRRHRVASVDDLASDGDRVLVDVDGQEIGVFRVDGEFYALANYCVHEGGPLCEGAVVGEMSVGDDGLAWEYDDDDGAERFVVCPWHEWTFDVTTGEHVGDSRYVTPTFDVEVDDGDVYVLR
jgi:nitrite reductase/ring-hydroxylating ferredoxin subunit